MYLVVREREYCFSLREKDRERDRVFLGEKGNRGTND